MPFAPTDINYSTEICQGRSLLNLSINYILIIRENGNHNDHKSRNHSVRLPNIPGMGECQKAPTGTNYPTEIYNGDRP
ncbi:MAG: hypothetical protein SWX82_18105 [Cyanobacteriota bacterium]|nr:hypothetical protein [Cyanobacteriota bacterium]